MENYKIKNRSHSNSAWSGLILLIIGVVFFLRSFGIYIPGWILSWPMLLIAIGLFIGFKRNFRGGGWLIMVLIGGYFTLGSIADFDIRKYYFSLAFIGLGLYLIFKPKRNRDRWKKKFDESQFSELNNEKRAQFEQDPSFSAAGGAANEGNVSDFIDSVNAFGGTHHKVYSKNFKGGDVVAIFGGCEINLTQADFEGTVRIDVVALFGGVKIIVPSTWLVKSEATAIFGGIDDKRAVVPFEGEGARKILIIEGVAIFGGVDIRNF
ncbi:hypothetical protein DBR11_09460 [Pedobacter sp. HMWF019]|uniref:LiaF transmembrane domain-containing protein n=1 Tax=Pedobacter sp. HMWF019 TaxID=2056856 RepID=UPI000D3DAFF2|nr:DUF5668 domain-containing protein [Pedobacter sp. HMWF019]PTT00638.1 hypothetical protein DBR11_09460 [Pedobacter sp. HMWF019]